MASQRQILVVEDNELNRSILCEILSGEYDVLEAENGQQALEILEGIKERVSLILLDLRMPVMDGYTFLDRLGQDPSLSPIPVIAMTQSEGEDEEVTALAHGATDFVPKPYRPQVILHRVASIIKLRETAAMINQFQYDQLTGLYSREYFYQKARELLAQHPEREYSVICVNMENFKLFNDVFGIQAGDRLLQEIAEQFRALTEDTGICGRYRADRFVCLKERSPRYKERLAHGYNGDSGSILSTRNVVLKWGLYEVNDKTVPVERMCDRANLAAESIKGQYNQHVAVYDATLREKLLREQAITDAMETALEQGQFVMYLQPKYCLSCKCMTGAEALVRWDHPEWGLLSPGEFIPLFERNGFIPRLDRYIWEQACALLQSWKKKGYRLVPISVNVSRADIYEVHFAETLLELTEAYGVDPAYLHLELTESACAENLSQIITEAEKLHGLGFPIEMDDFGSGYSSLNLLGRINLDTLKLDAQLVQNETAKPAGSSILGDIIRMAHRMYLSVVAEGVEEQAQLEQLQELECDYAQGFYFSRPMPVAEFEEVLRTQPAMDSSQPPS